VRLAASGSVRRLPFQSGQIDSCQIWQAARDLPLVVVRQISSRSADSIDFDLWRAVSCRPKLLHRSQPIERRAPSSVRRCRTAPPIDTKFRRQMHRTAASTTTKFQVDRTSRFQKAVDARSPTLGWRVRPAVRSPSVGNSGQGAR
jgi:hypothetical protein